MHKVVTVHDIADAHGFVAATLRRFERDRKFVLPHDERDELHLEGVCILLELAGGFEPHRPGYERPGSFAAYASVRLPQRLGDAWHQHHPEHHRITLEDGSRKWQYLMGPVSLDDQRARHEDAFGELDERGFLDPRYWTSVPSAAEAA